MVHLSFRGFGIVRRPYIFPVKFPPAGAPRAGLFIRQHEMIMCQADKSCKYRGFAKRIRRQRIRNAIFDVGGASKSGKPREYCPAGIYVRPFPPGLPQTFCSIRCVGNTTKAGNATSKNSSHAQPGIHVCAMVSLKPWT